MTLVSRIRTRLLAIGAALLLALSLTAVVAPQPAHAVCGKAVSFHGRIGYALCGTTLQSRRFTDGSERAVLIGLDSAVWNIVFYPSSGYVSNWASLGGKAKTRVGFTSYNGALFKVRTVGTNGLDYCKQYSRSGGGWSRSWVRC